MPKKIPSQEDTGIINVTSFPSWIIRTLVQVPLLVDWEYDR